MASWEWQCASQSLHFQVPFFVFKGALGQIIPNSTWTQLEFLKHLMWTIHSLYFQLTKKTGNGRFYSATPHSTQSNPNKKKTSHPPPEVYQPKFTPENMLFKQQDKTFVDLRLSILFGGVGGTGPLGLTFQGLFLPCLLAVQLPGVPDRVQVPRANMKHPPRRKTTTKVPSEPPQRDETKPWGPSHHPRLYIWEIELYGGPL